MDRVWHALLTEKEAPPPPPPPSSPFLTPLGRRHKVQHGESATTCRSHTPQLEAGVHMITQTAHQDSSSLQFNAACLARKQSVKVFEGMMLGKSITRI